MICYLKIHEAFKESSGLLPTRWLIIPFGLGINAQYLVRFHGVVFFDIVPCVIFGPTIRRCGIHGPSFVDGHQEELCYEAGKDQWHDDICF
jgi:hypothetical protein